VPVAVSDTESDTESVAVSDTESVAVSDTESVAVSDTESTRGMFLTADS
jgi:hypothetical protein